MGFRALVPRPNLFSWAHVRASYLGNRTTACAKAKRNEELVADSDLACEMTLVLAYEQHAGNTATVTCCPASSSKPQQNSKGCHGPIWTDVKVHSWAIMNLCLGSVGEYDQQNQIHGLCRRNHVEASIRGTCSKDIAARSSQGAVEQLLG